jgi:hypothetical protein
MIDFEKLDRADIWIVSEEPTPEGDKLLSEYIKAYKAKEARSKKARPIPSAGTALSARKKAKVTAK